MVLCNVIVSTMDIWYLKINSQVSVFYWFCNVGSEGSAGD